jgi:dipeptidyl aminopeptidase/acylaminoacyl peptidase
MTPNVGPALPAEIRTAMRIPAGLVIVLLLASSLRAAPAGGDDPRRPPAIQTENVPPVPPELVARLAQYQNTRTAGFAGWAPDGTGMLIVTRFGNAAQLHRVYEPGGRREQITFFDEPVGGRFIPGVQDGAMIMSMSKGGDENYQLHLLDRKNFTTTLLTDGKSRNQLGPISRDGSRAIVHSNRRNGRDTDIYVISPRDPGLARMVLAGNGKFWNATDISPDGKTLLVINYVSINESYLATLALDAPSDKPAEPKIIEMPAEGKSSVGGAMYSIDGKSIYLTTDARGEFQELARFDVGTKSFKWLSEDIKWDVESLDVDQKTGNVAFTVNENGASRLYLLHDDRRHEIKTPLGTIDGIEFSPDGHRIGLSISRPDAPADAYSISFGLQRIDRWTFSEVGGLDSSKFVVPQLVKFPTFDRREIPAYYFRPRTASAQNPAGVVILIHGGPESQFRPDFSGLLQFFVNELGVAVLAPNVRGSAGYGKTYLKLDNATLREDSVKDIGALLDWIGRQDELDGKRVAVMGGSYGGYMVLASLTHFSDRIRAGIDIVGIANFNTFLERTAAYRQDLRRAEYGDERKPEIREFFNKISPTNNAQKIRSALLVAHGRNDPRVPFFEAQQIAETVRGQGRDVWTVYADNEGHGFAKKDNRDYLTAVQALFLSRFLDLKPTGGER